MQGYESVKGLTTRFGNGAQERGRADVFVRAQIVPARTTGYGRSVR